MSLIKRFKEMLEKYPKIMKIIMWVLVVFVTAVAVTVFFLSFSLSRHKKMIRNLEAAIQKQEKIYKAKLYKAETDKKDLQLQLKAASLRADNEKEKEKRKQIDKEIQANKKKQQQAEKDMRTEVNSVDKQDMKKLLLEAKKMLKEVF